MVLWLLYVCLFVVGIMCMIIAFDLFFNLDVNINNKKEYNKKRFEWGEND